MKSYSYFFIFFILVLSCETTRNKAPKTQTKKMTTYEIATTLEQRHRALKKLSHGDKKQKKIKKNKKLGSAIQEEFVTLSSPTSLDHRRYERHFHQAKLAYLKKDFFKSRQYMSDILTHYSAQRISRSQLYQHDFSKRVFVLYAALKIKEGEFADGSQVLSSLIQHNPKWSPPYLLLWQSLEGIGADKLALNVARKAMDALRMQNAQAWVIYVSSLIKVKEFQKAWKALEQASQIFPNAPELSLMKTQLLVRENRVKESCQRLKAQNPSQGHIMEAKWFSLLCLIEEGRVKRAERELETLTLRREHVARYDLLRGYLHQKKGDREKAVKLFKSFSRHFSDNQRDAFLKALEIKASLK